VWAGSLSGYSWRTVGAIVRIVLADPPDRRAAVRRCRERPAPHRARRHGAVTAQVPADAVSIIFGFFLNGRGQIELRNPQLDPHPATGG